MDMISKINMLVLFLVFSSVAGFIFDDPCDVSPQYPKGIPDSDDFTTTVIVPENCKNGTFRWDYPKGHTMLEFNNTVVGQIYICIRDSLVGDLFTITDTSSTRSLGHIDYKTWSCFAPTSARNIELQIDAPEMMTYVGGFEYKITHG